MRIRRVEIENYRCIEAATIDFDPLTAIVGRNGAGKSTVLSALSLFYSLTPQLTEYDYFNCDVSRSIKIKVTFDSLTDGELGEFASYVCNGTLAVTKSITTGGAVYKGVRPQIPEFSELRRASFAQARTALRDLAGTDRFRGLPPAVRSKEELSAVLDSYEATHPELLVELESETQFLGPTNVGGGKLDKHTRFVRVPAVRDATGELDRKGAIIQLLDVLVLRSMAARPEVRELNEHFEQRVRATIHATILPNFRRSPPT